ncbi:prepilin-type N-terminal cleavage/methylation domain-containing protein [Ralstonia pseudosolanacearum]|uniref:Prepilin-type N-terminal cleavage/methylation domain-containing protein n=1 Tax=Ralstonia solanacearum TaxID=305 RepID=A0ABY6NA90_RALSL|nr:prepilin-type N-terminal cleavage/methylation domain-containing protein [Ralstonia solanacearum]
MRTIRRILPRRTRGFSLVELMVALVIALLVLAATVSFYLMTRSTYTTIEDTSGLEERGQFALNVMTRVLRQAGFTKLSTDNGGIMRLSASDAPHAFGAGWLCRERGRRQNDGAGRRGFAIELPVPSNFDRQRCHRGPFLWGRYGC